MWKEMDFVKGGIPFGVKTDRMEVPGGWVVRTITSSQSNGDVSVVQTFVPDPEHEWKLENQ